MRQRFWQAILGIGLLLGVSGAAVADFVYTLDTNNIAIPGPIGTATVHLIDSTHASVTFLANNPTFNYWFSDGGAVAVNVNAATWIATATGNCASCSPLANGGAGNEDGFGSFKQTFNAGSGAPGDRSTSITVLLTNTSGTWASDMVVLIGNASGFSVAAHVFVCPQGINGTCSATGFATNGSGGVEQQGRVPEPGMLGLLAIGLLASGVTVVRRRAA